jgi:hypothetical protein
MAIHTVTSRLVHCRFISSWAAVRALLIATVVVVTGVSLLSCSMEGTNEVDEPKDLILVESTASLISTNVAISETHSWYNDDSEWVDVDRRFVVADGLDKIIIMTDPLSVSGSAASRKAFYQNDGRRLAQQIARSGEVLEQSGRYKDEEVPAGIAGLAFAVAVNGDPTIQSLANPNKILLDESNLASLISSGAVVVSGTTTLLSHSVTVYKATGLAEDVYIYPEAHAWVTDGGVRLRLDMVDDQGVARERYLASSVSYDVDVASAIPPVQGEVERQYGVGFSPELVSLVRTDYLEASDFTGSGSFSFPSNMEVLSPTTPLSNTFQIDGSVVVSGTLQSDQKKIDSQGFMDQYWFVAQGFSGTGGEIILALQSLETMVLPGHLWQVWPSEWDGDPLGLQIGIYDGEETRTFSDSTSVKVLTTTSEVSLGHGVVPIGADYVVTWLESADSRVVLFGKGISLEALFLAAEAYRQ